MWLLKKVVAAMIAGLTVKAAPPVHKAGQGRLTSRLIADPHLQQMRP